MDCQLVAVAQSVQVAVEHMDIGVVGVQFARIRQPVRIGVLIPVDRAIPVRVRESWICPQQGHLNPVEQSIPVGVAFCGVGLVEVDLFPVSQAVLVDVRDCGIGVVLVQFLRIR